MTEDVVVFAVVVVAVAAVVGLLVWRQVRLKQAEAALKQESVRKGLSVADIQHLLELPTAATAADLAAIGTVARELAAKGVSGSELEQHIALVQGADTPTKQAVAHAFFQMASNFSHPPDKEQLLAVLRGCCSAARLKASGEGDVPAVPVEPSAAADGGRDARFAEFNVTQPGRRS